MDNMLSIKKGHVVQVAKEVWISKWTVGLFPQLRKKNNEEISANNISTRAVNIGVGISVDNLLYLYAIMAYSVKVLQDRDIGKSSGR